MKVHVWRIQATPAAKWIRVYTVIGNNFNIGHLHQAAEIPWGSVEYKKLQHLRWALNRDAPAIGVAIFFDQMAISYLERHVGLKKRQPVRSGRVGKYTDKYVFFG